MVVLSSAELSKDVIALLNSEVQLLDAFNQLYVRNLRSDEHLCNT